MFKYTILCAVLFAPLYSHAASDTPATNNEDLHALSERVQQLEQQQTNQQPAAGTNAFNPDVSLILEGAYSNLQRDPAVPATGFALSPNNNVYVKGLSLQESELGLSANIDPQFRGVATFALLPAGGASVENAFVQTTTLGNGFNLKFGRFFSGLGYLNEQHSHTWDFVDQPLVYRIFWDNQLADDGVQFKWLAPTDAFIEIGAELGNGQGYPGTDPQKNGTGAGVLFAHVGDDIGVSSSWRAGVSLHQTKQSNLSNSVPDLTGTLATESFSGDAHTAGMDFVWKYAPDGNSTVTNFKLLGEYFRRTQNGLLTYNNLTTDSYAVTQSGWYVQGVYQFMPNWRTGLRYDRLDPGNAQVGASLATSVISNYGYTPTRSTLMFDYSPSEFSRLRLQLARDNSRQGLPDNQIFLQYIMSLGAHGAHQF
ncbi:MAG TPA: hypothetical protein VKG67_05210 [Gallionellaceae bacterium]|nr:hypothetical protein [Gallionellaceae bacterium]